MAKERVIYIERTRVIRPQPKEIIIYRDRETTRNLPAPSKTTSSADDVSIGCALISTLVILAAVGWVIYECFNGFTPVGVTACILLCWCIVARIYGVFFAPSEKC